MNPDLEKLIELQKIDEQIGAAKKTYARIEKEIAALNEKIKATHKEQTSMEAQLDEVKKEHRKQERELEVEEEKVKKHKGQLTSVKTNREYSALQGEIAEEEKGLGKVEEKIIQALENIDKFQNKVKETKEHVKAAEKEISAEVNEKKKSLEEAKKDIAAKDEIRKKIMSEVKPNLLTEYNKLLVKKGGVAMARVKDCICQACYINIPPQDYEVLKRGQKVYFCSSCSRILYVDRTV